MIDFYIRGRCWKRVAEVRSVWNVVVGDFWKDYVLVLLLSMGEYEDDIILLFYIHKKN
jgi:hypothetical protein